MKLHTRYREHRAKRAGLKLAQETTLQLNSVLADFFGLDEKGEPKLQVKLAKDKGRVARIFPYGGDDFWRGEPWLQYSCQWNFTLGEEEYLLSTSHSASLAESIRDGAFTEAWVTGWVERAVEALNYSFAEGFNWRSPQHLFRRHGETEAFPLAPWEAVRFTDFEEPQGEDTKPIPHAFTAELYAVDTGALLDKRRFEYGALTVGRDYELVGVIVKGRLVATSQLVDYAIFSLVGEDSTFAEERYLTDPTGSRRSMFASSFLQGNSFNSTGPQKTFIGHVGRYLGPVLAPSEDGTKLARGNGRTLALGA